MAALIGDINRRATAFLALLGSVGIFAMLVHICAYVVSRHIVASPIPATVEIVSNYYMVLIAFLPIAWAERRGDMISVEVFTQLLKGRLKTINIAFVAIVTAGAYAVLTYTTWLVAMDQFKVQSYVISLSTNIPIWPSYFILPISFGLATLVCLLKVALIFTDASQVEPVKHVPEEDAFK